MKNRDGIKVKGYVKTWYVIAEEVIEGRQLFLLENEVYGDDFPCLIVDNDCNMVVDDVYNGFLDYREMQGLK